MHFIFFSKAIIYIHNFFNNIRNLIIVLYIIKVPDCILRKIQTLNYLKIKQYKNSKPTLMY